MKDLLYLNGYGFYVWGSYFVTFALLAIELAVLHQRTKKQSEANETAP
jgi:heme exporter protein CcmD